MTVIGNLIASFQIFISNYTARFGHFTNIVLIILLVAFVVLGVIKTARLPKISKYKLEEATMDADERRAAMQLSQALTYQTTTGNREEMERFIAFLKQEYQEVFDKIHAIFLPEGSILLCWKAPLKPVDNPVLISGHLDVALPGGGWKKRPFGGEDDGTALWGRGALDFKGPVIAQLNALQDLLKEGYVPRRDIYFAYSTDAKSDGAEDAKRMAEMLQKKKVRFDFVLEQGGYVSSALMNNKSYSAAIIGVAEKGEALLRLTAKGAGGHSGAPKKHTAVGSIAEAVCRIENAPMHRRLLPCVIEYLKQSSSAMNGWQRLTVANPSLLRPFLYGAFKNNAVVQSLFRTTMAVTQTSGSENATLLPDTSVAMVSVSLLQGDTGAKVLQHIKTLTADLPITVELVYENLPSEVTSTESSGFDLMKNTITKVYGSIPTIPALGPTSTDSRHYAAISDHVFRFVPVVLSRSQVAAIHNADENIKRSSLGTATEFYRQLFSAL